MDSEWYLNKDPKRGGWVYFVVDTRDPEKVRYVGKTQVSVTERKAGHWYDALRVPRKTNSRIANWLRKRTDCNSVVEFRTQGFYPTLEELNAAECYWISELRKQGMADLNITAGGDGQTGVRPSEATRRKMSEAHSGERHHNARLTWSDVRSLRALRSREYVSRFELAERFGVAPSTIERILMGLTWKDPEFSPGCIVPAPVDRSAENNGRSVLTWEIVNSIRSRRKTSWIATTELAREYGVGKSAVGYILANKTWPDPEYDPSSLRKRSK